MSYIHERNYGCRVSADYTYRGLKTIVLEHQELRVLVRFQIITKSVM